MCDLARAGSFFESQNDAVNRVGRALRARPGRGKRPNRARSARSTDWFLPALLKVGFNRMVPVQRSTTHQPEAKSNVAHLSVERSTLSVERLPSRPPALATRTLFTRPPALSLVPLLHARPRRRR